MDSETGVTLRMSGLAQEKRRDFESFRFYKLSLLENTDTKDTRKNFCSTTGQQIHGTFPLIFRNFNAVFLN